VGIAAACGAPARVQTPAADRIAAIRIEGNQALPTGELEPALALHDAIGDGAAIDPFLVTADINRIRAAYLKRGFFEVQVTARVDRGGGGSPVVVLHVVEGRRATTRVEVTGLPPELATAQARALVALREGAPFDYAAYEEAKQPLTALVVNAGYAHAAVRTSVLADPTTATATLRYDVVAGVRCTFGAIRLPDGLPGTLRDAVRARLTFAPGDRFSQRALDQSQAAIYEIGRFSSARFVAEGAADDAVVAIAIELVEASRYELHVGGGVGYDPLNWEVRGLGGFGITPAALPLLTFSTDARVAVTTPHQIDVHELRPKILGLAALRYLDLLWPRMRAEAELGASYQTVEAYTWTGEHLGLAIASPLCPRWLQLRIGWVLEALAFTDVSAALDPDTKHRLRLDRPQRRGAYQASLQLDLRDNPIEPHRGALLDLRATYGTPAAGGDLTYLQLTPEAHGYLSIGGGIVVAARARVGAIYGDVPVTERYFSGGTSGQRGFAARQLSPLAGAPHAVAIGGAGLLETGVELRRRLGTVASYPVGVNVFLDGADVTETPAELDPGNLYWAAGVGGWAKPVGDFKVRIDLGYRLNERGPQDPLRATRWLDKLAFALGIGEAF